jgi:hypothetical protein
LPKKIFDKLLILLGKKEMVGDYMHLLSKRAIKKLLNDNIPLKKCVIKRNYVFFFAATFSIFVKK